MLDDLIDEVFVVLPEILKSRPLKHMSLAFIVWNFAAESHEIFMYRRNARGCIVQVR
jgi:hypothetical protein